MHFLHLLPYLVVGVLAVSCASLFVRFAQADGMATLAIAAWRLTFASTVLLPYAWVTRRQELRAVTWSELGLLLAAGVSLGLHFATWIASLGHTSVASSVVLVSMGPVFVAIGSWVFLGERPSRKTVGGIGVATLGGVVISVGDFDLGGTHLFGDLLALGGAAFVAAYLMIGRHVRGRLSLAVYVAPVYGAAMVTLLVIVAVGRQPMLGYNLTAYGWALALGLVPQLIGHTTLNWALRHVSATFVSLVTLTEPLGAGLLAYMVLGESITLQTAAGGIFVLAGVYIASRGELAAA